MSQFKPYPVYKDSGVEWLGEVPEHWSAHHLKRTITKIESGTSVNAADYPAELGALGVLKTSCVYTGQFDWKENKTVDDNDLEKVSCPLVLNTLVVSRMNTPELVGATGLVTEAPQNIYLPDRLWQVYFEKTQSPLFIFYFTKSFEYRTQVKTVCSGTSSSMQNLGQDDFRAILLAVPSLHEQTQIARFLDYETARIDALIEEQKHLIELLKEKRQAVISHSVTQGLEPAVPMKDSCVEWLGDIPEHWMLRKFFFGIKKIIDNRGRSPVYIDHGIPILEAKQLSNETMGNSLDFSKYISNDSYSEFVRDDIASGDILMVTVGSIGKVGIVGDNSNFVIIQNIVGFRVSDDVSPEFMAVYLKSRAAFMAMQATNKESILSSVKVSDFIQHKMPIPPLCEQKLIAESVNADLLKLEVLQQEASTLCSTLQERRSALITAAVTGKIDVRDWQPPADSSIKSAAAQKACLEAV